MASSPYADDLCLAHVLADQVERITMSRFQADDLVVESKPDLTPVSDADRSCEEAIRAQLDISPVRYHQRLNLLLDAPAAAQSHPLLVARLRRLREEREDTRRAAQGNAPDS